MKLAAAERELAKMEANPISALEASPNRSLPRVLRRRSSASKSSWLSALGAQQGFRDPR